MCPTKHKKITYVHCVDAALALTKYQPWVRGIDDFICQPPNEGETLVVLRRREQLDGDVLALVEAGPLRRLLLQVQVGLLLDVEVDDARELLLPDLEAGDADVVLDVLEGAAEAGHGAAQLDQLGRQFAASRSLKNRRDIDE